MKRQDYVIFFLLIVLLVFWPNIYQTFFDDKQPARPAAASTLDETAPAETVDGISTTAPAVETPAATDAVAAVEEPVATPAAAVAEEPAAEEVLTILTNAQLRLVFSSRGAALVGATLVDYRERLPLDSSLITLDFTERTALAYSGIPGWGEQSDFTLDEVGSDRLIYSRTAGGLRFSREVVLVTNYQVKVIDSFSNVGPDQADLGQHRIRTGAIPEEAAHNDIAGMINMGVDALPPAGGVENWGKTILKQFKNERDERELATLPEEITFQPSPKPADWVAAKNKYFVQILMPDPATGGADWIEIFARRHVTAAERAGTRVKEASIAAVAATLGFQNQSLVPGETYTRSYEYFVGPKDYRILSTLSHNRDGAMGFEENAYMDFIVVPTAKLLLRLLNLLHDYVISSYGVAIILLTLIVKIVFWPITHKGTESMRRMASVQPLMAEIREKYKDNPQKMQQAMMALYKEHKINPLGGCLPMLVQIPVFFALFVVLRTAIELRFADFLWIADLSAPERLIEFGFALPLLGWDALNILPLLMTATMIIQMKVSPTAGDPQQQKLMMIMMPAMMLFFLYNFASGLALYWTTQNILMIIQQLAYKQRKKIEETHHTPAKA